MLQMCFWTIHIIFVFMCGKCHFKGLDTHIASGYWSEAHLINIKILSFFIDFVSLWGGQYSLTVGFIFQEFHSKLSSSAFIFIISFTCYFWSWKDRFSFHRIFQKHLLLNTNRAYTSNINISLYDVLLTSLAVVTFDSFCQ